MHGKRTIKKRKISKIFFFKIVLFSHILCINSYQIWSESYTFERFSALLYKTGVKTVYKSTFILFLCCSISEYCCFFINQLLGNTLYVSVTRKRQQKSMTPKFFLSYISHMNLPYAWETRRLSRQDWSGNNGSSPVTS